MATSKRRGRGSGLNRTAARARARDVDALVAELAQHIIARTYVPKKSDLEMQCEAEPNAEGVS